MPDVVKTVEELVETASLVSIEIDELGAERKPGDASEEVSVEPAYDLTLNLRDDFAGFRVRLLTTIDVPIGLIRCGVYAEYELSGSTIGSESTEAVGVFVNNVALMHVLPYVRQSIADITLRVFNGPLLMPIIQRGEISFKVELNDDADFPPSPDG